MLNQIRFVKTSIGQRSVPIFSELGDSLMLTFPTSTKNTFRFENANFCKMHVTIVKFSCSFIKPSSCYVCNNFSIAVTRWTHPKPRLLFQKPSCRPAGSRGQDSKKRVWRNKSAHRDRFLELDSIIKAS